MGLIQRWVIGAGGFIGEASLITADPTLKLPAGMQACELTDVYVHPMRRGNGWARAVVETALAHADAHRWMVVLRVAAHGKRGRWGALTPDQLRTFYGSLGFKSTKADPDIMVRRVRGGQRAR